MLLDQFAHLGLLLNEDRSKLSKRQGDVAVEDFRVRIHPLVTRPCGLRAHVVSCRTRASCRLDWSTLSLCLDGTLPAATTRRCSSSASWKNRFAVLD